MYKTFLPPNTQEVTLSIYWLLLANLPKATVPKEQEGCPLNYSCSICSNGTTLSVDIFVAFKRGIFACTTTKGFYSIKHKRCSRVLSCWAIPREGLLAWYTLFQCLFEFSSYQNMARNSKMFPLLLSYWNKLISITLLFWVFISVNSESAYLANKK